MSVWDSIDRFLFGASATEAVEMRVKLAKQQIEEKIIEQKIVAALDRLDRDDEGRESAGGDDERGSSRAVAD